MNQRQPSRLLLPTLWLFTDDRMGDALWPALHHLPAGSGVVIRHYALAHPDRLMLAQRIVTIARRRGLCILWSGRASDAVRMGADGVHAAHGRKLPLRSRHPHLIRSVPVHTLRERRKAEQHGADIIFLSPVFATRTHPGAVPLRPMQALALARGTRWPALASCRPVR